MQYKSTSSFKKHYELFVSSWRRSMEIIEVWIHIGEDQCQVFSLVFVPPHFLVPASRFETTKMMGCLQVDVLIWRISISKIGIYTIPREGLG